MDLWIIKFIYDYFLEELLLVFYVESYFRLYDGVEMFFLFIGYLCSIYSLVGVLLDVYLEIIILYEYGVLGKWEKYCLVWLKKKKNL